MHARCRWTTVRPGECYSAGMDTVTLGFLAVTFTAGVLTVIAPCILPLLPVIVGGSLTGEASLRRAAVIVASLGVSVFAFTLALKATTAFIAIPALFWQLLSGVLLIIFGAVTLVPSLWDRIPGVQALYRGSNKLLGSGFQKGNLWGDIVMGAALGPVFSSCSPTYFVILAAVLPANLGAGIAYLISYVLGMCLFLLLIAYLGQRVALKLDVVADAGGWFRRILGIIFILVGVAVIFGLDKRLEAALPAGAYGEISFEQRLLSALQQGGAPAAPAAPQGGSGSLPAAAKLLSYQKAPELAGIAGYINTDGRPVTIGEFIGKKVVLIDFWDYSCINCQRTIPYLNAWHEKYKDQGLVIIGVHTPEFAFEQLQPNVQAAVDRFGIRYPVVLDNAYATWGAFKNQYWPREYLIDIDGYIVHDHAGEGQYEESERAIQDALAERTVRLGLAGLPATSTVGIAPADLSGIGSPETYFGSARNEFLGNATPGVSGTGTLPLPDAPVLNTLYLGGAWTILPEYAEGKKGSEVLYRYSSRNVYFVATNVGPAVRIRILRDGKPLGAAAGADVDSSTSEAHINGNRLFELVRDTAPGTHTLKIIIEEGTLDAYTFTFG